MLGSVAARDEQLSGLIVSLQQFVTGLAGDREAIFDSLQTIDALAVATTGLLEDARPPLAADIQALGDLAGNLADTGDVRGGLPAARPDQDRPDHPHGDQRQLVQLLRLRRRRLGRCRCPTR